MMPLWSVGAVNIILLVSVIEGYKNTGLAPAALRVRPPPMIRDHIAPTCWNFTYGNWKKMEFYSPNYPHEYYNNTDCVLYLEAPIGFKIQLDFRDKFELEKSDDCKYDYLEIRDGPFAYSPLIGRFCGDNYPPLVESKTRFLWMRFKTDDLLQYGGFRAIYEYIKSAQNDGTSFNKAPPVCRIEMRVNAQNPDGVITSQEFPFGDVDDPNYPTHQPVDCTWEIHTEPGYGIYVHTDNLKMKTPRRCDHNYIEMYTRTTLESNKHARYCAGPEAKMKSAYNRVFVRVFGNSVSTRPSVRLIYTVFRRDAMRATECTSSEFYCAEMCFNRKLLCNGLRNCPDGLDEDNCVKAAITTSVEGIPLYVIVVASLGGVLLTLVVIGLCVWCRARSRRAEKKKQEELRLEKQQQRRGLDRELSNSTNTTLSRQNGSSSGSGAGSGHYAPFPRGGTTNKDPTHRYSLGSSVQHSSEGDPAEQLSESGNYKKFLAMDLSPDEEFSPCPTLYSQTGVVTVERHPGPDLKNAGLRGFYANNWRNDDPLASYPYTTSLSRPSPFLSVSKPYTYSPEHKFFKGMSSFRNIDSDIIQEHPTSS
ncbi:neuropilin and tolloid-like protein 2 [Gigantopelta aegis]|uniref:neuropilin and tolloid-like protein 2 n=1 Tax=Gigantopelta aegis TaxID=1735272 RepID=UPI001B88C164|nr:neuropilin and tolloid-like protein 2 [Gigantopelta aegis]